MTTAFTPSDIDRLLETAVAQGLPDVLHTAIDGATATLRVSDRDAVEQWAMRLETSVQLDGMARPWTGFARHGYEVRIVSYRRDCGANEWSLPCAFCEQYDCLCAVPRPTRPYSAPGGNEPETSR